MAKLIRERTSTRHIAADANWPGNDNNKIRSVITLCDELIRANPPQEDTIAFGPNALMNTHRDFSLLDVDRVSFVKSRSLLHEVRCTKCRFFGRVDRLRRRSGCTRRGFS